MRAMRPGSKWDAMLILQGAQGIGKSSLFETLAYDHWHTDYVPFDAKQQEWEEATSGYWILECSELKGLKGARLEAINNRLASRKTTVRRAYGQGRGVYARCGVFAGTTNDAQPLSDPTGLRRYWVMGIEGVDRQGLLRDRDQLWAEVRDRGLWKKERLALPRELWAASAAVARRYREDNPYVEYLRETYGGSCRVGAAH